MCTPQPLKCFSYIQNISPIPNYQRNTRFNNDIIHVHHLRAYTTCTSEKLRIQNKRAEHENLYWFSCIYATVVCCIVKKLFLLLSVLHIIIYRQIITKMSLCLLYTGKRSPFTTFIFVLWTPSFAICYESSSHYLAPLRVAKHCEQLAWVGQNQWGQDLPLSSAVSCAIEESLQSCLDHSHWSSGCSRQHSQSDDPNACMCV